MPSDDEVPLNIVLPLSIQERAELHRWEYQPFRLEISPHTGQIDWDQLNAMGRAGWQVCAFLPFDSSLLLIREILPESTPGPEEDAEKTD